MSSTTRALWSSCLVACLALTACTAPSQVLDAGDAPPPMPTATDIGTPTGAAVEATIGPDGGQLSSVDGRMTVAIPPGALAAPTVISIQPITNTAHGARGDAYALLPEGQTFATPVQLRWHYTDADVEGSAPEYLGLAVQNADRFWELQYDGATIDTATSTLTVPTSHFSRWGPMQEVTLEPPMATVKIDESATFFVKWCVDFRKRVAGSKEPVLLTECSKLSVTYGANTLGAWAVNGTVGGDSTRGTIRGDIERGFFVAPMKVPSPDVVTISVEATDPYTKKMTPLKSKARIVTGQRSYRGYYTFVFASNGIEISGNIDPMTWDPVDEAADVRRYKPSGTIVANLKYPDCDPIQANLEIPGTGAGELVVYTAQNVAFANQYQFSVFGQATVALSCGSPRKTVQTQVGVNGMVGLCNAPPFARFTNEEHLQGNGPCSDGKIVSSEWSLVRDP